jgi:hypothetical protein
MTFTEQELRESLRRTTAAPPPARDRMSLVEGAVRRRHRRVVVATVAAVVLALVAVPVVRLLPDRLRHNAIPAGTSPAQVDAMMKYATFVTVWTGRNMGVRNFEGDAGVVGIHLDWNLPPFMCVAASVEEGDVRGTQGAWVLATPSAITGTTVQTRNSEVLAPVVLWPVGVSSCDPPTAPEVHAAGPSGPLAETGVYEFAFGQSPSAPARPAMDVEAVFHAIPPDLVTDFGRRVFDNYESSRPTSYGTATEQLDRVLTALASWMSIALSHAVLTSPSPATGPQVLTADSYVGTAELPAGYAARWNTTTGALCVQGSIGSSGVRHFTENQFGEPGSPPLSPLDGPCR